MTLSAQDQWHAPVDSQPATPNLALGATVRRALGWSFLGNFVGRVGGSLVGIVLARILAPQDYGVYAVALIALNALLSMNELGVSLAIVRWPGDVRRIAPTVFTLALVSSSLLYVGCFFLAPVIAGALGAPQASGILRLLCLGVVADAFVAVPGGLMTREFMQRRRLVIDTIAFAVVSVLSIGLAINGAGAWSLAVGGLAGNVVTAVLIFALAPARFAPGFDRGAARELLSFGLPLAGASLLVFAMLNLDYTIVGRTLGPLALGFYLLAFNLSSWPVNIFSAPVRRVAMPGFARLLHDPAQAAQAFSRAWTLLLTATLPAVLLLAVFAKPLIGFLYGDKWLPAASALAFLALLAGVRVLAELAYDYLVAHGRSRTAFTVQSIWLAALVPVLIAGARIDGFRGVAIGHALVALVIVLPAFVVAVSRSGVSAWGLFTGVLRPLAGCLVAAAAAVAVLEGVTGQLGKLVVGGCIVLAVYAAAVYPMRRLVSTLVGPAGSEPDASPPTPVPPTHPAKHQYKHVRGTPMDKIDLVDLAAQHAEIADEVRDGFADVLSTTAFVQGKQVTTFEEEYARYIGVAHCIGVGNGTDALEIGLRAAGVGSDDEVILPANTFVATAEAVARIGAHPVLADVQDDTMLIDPACAAAAAGPLTRAIVPVHLYGQIADMEALTELAAQFGAAVVEDAAQSQGARRHGRSAGSFGLAAGTSFYPGKNLGAYGDAGAVMTDSDEVGRHARLMANHGSERRYEHDVLGFNSRMDTLQAVVLRAKLARLDRWNEARQEAADRYARLLAGIPGVVLPVVAAGNQHVWHQYVIRVDNRDEVLRSLNEAGIGAAIHYPVPIHLHPAFVGLGQPRGSFPVAEAAASRIMSLPMHPHLTARQQERVAEALGHAAR